MYMYSDKEREDDKYALPDVEVFFAFADEWETDDGPNESGWYWWSCFPGCLPDSDPMGPFETEEEAIADVLNE